MTKELEKLISEYEKIFGYDPCCDEMFEIGDSTYHLFIDALKKSIETKKEIHDYLLDSDADEDDDY